jgi:hypothetical protein
MYGRFLAPRAVADGAVPSKTTNIYSTVWLRSSSTVTHDSDLQRSLAAHDDMAAAGRR